MGEAKHSYSIWAVPTGALAQEVQAEVDRLAARFPDAPSFLPHVTLVGGVEMTEQQARAATRQLGQRLQPYRLSLERVACGAIFHQCVYILCATDPATMQAGAAAREVCGMDPASPYMPHLSLLYSDIDLQQRQAVAEEEQQRLLEGPDAVLVACGGGFEVASVQLWLTESGDKSLASWRLVEEVALKRQ